MLAGNIKAARLRAHLTQKELALRLGVPRERITAWEAGRFQPDIANFMALCRTLAVTPESLSGASLTDELADLPQPVAELAQILAGLPAPTFAVIRKLILTVDDELHGKASD